MNKLATFVLIACAVSAFAVQEYPTPSGNDQVNNDSLVDWYNSAMDKTWEAGHNDYFRGMTFDDARILLGAQLSHISEHLNATLPDAHYAAMNDTIQTDFDSRAKWPGMIHPIRNQQNCGSCWAFSASEVLSDRVAIASGKASPALSPEDMVSCDDGDMGCRGGQLSMAWKYLRNTGIVTDTCFPYTAGKAGKAPTCETKCVDGQTFSKTKAKASYAIHGVTNMQKEIMTHGPIQVAFLVYKSFMAYKSGVYQKHFWELLPLGGHAVKIIGWGTEKGKLHGSTDYWLVANSWNTKWGLDGFFKIKRGSDQCGIETMGPPYAGMPAAQSLIV